MSPAAQDFFSQFLPTVPWYAWQYQKGCSARLQPFLFVAKYMIKINPNRTGLSLYFRWNSERPHKEWETGRRAHRRIRTPCTVFHQYQWNIFKGSPEKKLAHCMIHYKRKTTGRRVKMAATKAKTKKPSAKKPAKAAKKDVAVKSNIPPPTR